MTDVQDKIGVIRHHRWLSAAEQFRILQPRCRAVVSLGGGKAKIVSREDLERFVRPDTVIELAQAFLLADLKARKKPGGMKADYTRAVARIMKKGGIVSDIGSGLTTESEGHRKAMEALAFEQISRSNRGLKSALNGARSKGRPRPDFTKEQLASAKAIWRNIMDYPTWSEAQKALAEIEAANNGDKFTPFRANKLYGPRYERK